jgi:hypothetical protein
MAKKIGRRDFLAKSAGITAGFAVGMFGNLQFNSKEGVRFGKARVKFGMAEAHAECGASLDCAGGGGQCGASLDCAGS